MSNTHNVYRIYGDRLSGNCYKIELLLAHLGLEYDWQSIDITQGQSKSAEFLLKNPAGQIPVLQLPNGDYLSQSNAILNYLADGSIYTSQDRLQHARILEWQFFEQYSHEPYIAVARYIALYLGLPEDKRAEYESKQAGGHAALRVMERQLQQSAFLTGEQYTIADMSLFAYTHVAEQGGFDLNLYPAIQAWIARVQQQDGFVSMLQERA